VLAND
jgi:chromosome segregation ATPase